MVKRFFHLDFRPQEAFWLPVLGRVHRSTNATLRERLVTWSKSPGYELSLAVATKLRVIRLVAGRFNADLAELSKHLDAMPEKVEKAVTKHLALTLPSDDLGFRLVADVDAFLFETRSVYELTGKLLKEFFARILNRKLEEAELKKMLEDRNIDTTWIEVVRGDRKIFFHDTAPWIAVEVKKSSPRYDLIILKRNTHDLKDPHDYVRFEEYRSVYHEFVASMASLQSWVLEQVEQAEKDTPSTPPN